MTCRRRVHRSSVSRGGRSIGNYLASCGAGEWRVGSYGADAASFEESGGAVASEDRAEAEAEGCAAADSDRAPRCVAIGFAANSAADSDAHSGADSGADSGAHYATGFHFFGASSYGID